jgi:hypothetical protein
MRTMTYSIVLSFYGPRCIVNANSQVVSYAWTEAQRLYLMASRELENLCGWLTGGARRGTLTELLYHPFLL